MRSSFGKEEAEVTRKIEKANGLHKDFEEYRSIPHKKLALFFDGGHDQSSELEKAFPDRIEMVRDFNGNFVCQLDIVTKEGKMRLMPGDYLIMGLKGELYPCDSEIFELSYKRV